METNSNEPHQPHTAASFSALMLWQMEASFDVLLSIARGDFEEKFHHVVTARLPIETQQQIVNVRENLRSIILNATVSELQQARPMLTVIK